MEHEIEKNMIKGKIVEIADILHDASINTETYPWELYEKYGLDDPDEDFDERKSDKALEEWKDTLFKMIVLLREVASSEPNEFSEDCRKHGLKNAELHDRLETIKDKNSKEYLEVLNERNSLKEPTMKAYYKEEAYMNGCLNEVLDLFKKWWWEILRYGGDNV